MAPGARSKFIAPCSNLRSFGSKCTVLKKVLVTFLALLGAPQSFWPTAVIRRPGNCALLAPLVTPVLFAVKEKLLFL